MIVKTVDLYEYFSIPRPKISGAAGYLTTYLPSGYPAVPNRVRPAMVVFPGGGYRYCSERENECIALTFAAQGYAAFTVEYSVNVTYPMPLIEGCMAMAYVRENAKELAIDAEHIAVIGFSAGGHLAAMVSLISDEKEIKEVLGDRVKLCRPNASVLSYPVISGGEKAHRGSFDVLCGGDNELVERLSMENRVTENAPPAFIWATANDGAVPSENSLMLAMAYKKAGVPFELHVFEDGVHGLSLSNKEVMTVNEPVQKWVKMCITWLKNRGFEVID